MFVSCRRSTKVSKQQSSDFFSEALEKANQAFEKQKEDLRKRISDLGAEQERLEAIHELRGKLEAVISSLSDPKLAVVVCDAIIVSLETHKLSLTEHTKEDSATLEGESVAVQEETPVVQDKEVIETSADTKVIAEKDSLLKTEAVSEETTNEIADVKKADQTSGEDVKAESPEELEPSVSPEPSSFEDTVTSVWEKESKKPEPEVYGPPIPEEVAIRNERIRNRFESVRKNGESTTSTSSGEEKTSEKRTSRSAQSTKSPKVWKQTDRIMLNDTAAGQLRTIFSSTPLPKNMVSAMEKCYGPRWTKRPTSVSGGLLLAEDLGSQDSQTRNRLSETVRAILAARQEVRSGTRDPQTLNSPLFNLLSKYSDAQIKRVAVDLGVQL